MGVEKNLIGDIDEYVVHLAGILRRREWLLTQDPHSRGRQVFL